MMKKLLIILLSIAACGKAKAQDFHLSMYDAAPLFLNPAMTGLFEGKWRLHAQYRTQWKSVNFKPYTTGLVSFDRSYGKWGFGLQAMNLRAGRGNYNVFEGLASVSYCIPLTKDKAHNLSFGLQAGAKQKSIEYGLLTFNNQYSTDYGGTFEPSLATNENFGQQRRILPAANAGLLYFYAKQQSRLNPFIGISAFNLLQPDESFLKQDNERLPIRTYVHLGTRINITESFYLLPKVLVMNQRDFFQETFALDAGYFVKGSDLYLLGGLVYRNQDAMILSVGARMNSFIAKLAYDINISSLSLASTGRGGFELSFTYMKANPKAPASKICPRL